MKKGKNNSGFTLGELLIVVGIIAVLVAISIPIFNKQLERSRDKNIKRWDKLEASDNALDRVRGHQMKELTAQGPLEFEIPELTRMVLEEIIVRDPKTFTIKFLDGEIKNISL